MPIQVDDVGLYIHNMKARMPFKYGIATLTAVPHLFVKATVRVDGQAMEGVASDHLPPKWFTKDPEAKLEDEVADMLAVVQAARQHAIDLGEAKTPFDLWHRLYEKQADWRTGTAFPPLLANFGVSLIERAVIDAFCWATGKSFHAAVHSNSLGIDLGRIYPELEGQTPADFLPMDPPESLIARHTVGLGDPLTDADVPEGERVDDGLPQSLEAAIAAYGLTHFKIKLFGDVAKDRDRLTTLAGLLDKTGVDYRFTLDGNENFKSVEPFRELWEDLQGDASLEPFMQRLIVVEQPFHRDVALSEVVGDALIQWSDRPAIIIDESDAEMGSLSQALHCGYAGTSHKNCKGVFKGVLNRCRLEYRRRQFPTMPTVMTAEDLSNVGPVALLQDLAAVAALGIEHVERNGHHYFRGLSAFPEEVQQEVLKGHGDLYREHEAGFPTLRIEAGRIKVGSVNRSPFGVGLPLDVDQFTPLDEWRFETLGV